MSSLKLLCLRIGLFVKVFCCSIEFSLVRMKTVMSLEVVHGVKPSSSVRRLCVTTNVQITRFKVVQLYCMHWSRRCIPLGLQSQRQSISSIIRLALQGQPGLEVTPGRAFFEKANNGKPFLKNYDKIE